MPAPVEPRPGTTRSCAPAEQFLAQDDAVLLVEARDHNSAEIYFQNLLNSRSESEESAIVKLSPRLFFAQLAPSRKYWRFSQQTHHFGAGSDPYRRNASLPVTRPRR
jgi:hypothetical protein